MVAAGWVDPAGAGMIGAANLTGYLVGALSGRQVARRVGTATTLDIGMGLAAAAFAACAWQGGLLYLACWRGLAGVAGGLLMALAGPAVQWAVAASRRGQAGGIVVSGVGSGAVLSALVLPNVVPLGLTTAWLVLAGLVVVLWGLVHRSWPDAPIPPASQGEGRVRGAVRLLAIYALSGAGMVAHMVYLVDLAVRGRGMSAAAGATIWLLFGVGAVVGTLAGGRMADRWGASRALSVWLGIQIVAIGAAMISGTVVLGVAGLLGGFAGVGISAVGLARSREIGGARTSSVWAGATAAYAAAQAATAFGLAALLARTASHEALFGACLLLSAAGLVISLVPAGSAAAVGDA